MSLAMTPIIITGEIDLSVESMVGLSSCVLGWLWASGVPLQACIPIVLAVGVLGGLFNGFFVVRWGLPSLVVTLATYALFRGLGHVSWARRSSPTSRPASPTSASDTCRARTSRGRSSCSCFSPSSPWPSSMGPGSDARSSPSARTRRRRAIPAFASGLSRWRCSPSRVWWPRFAGILLTSRTSAATPDAGLNFTLAVVTIVVLGGVDINGGKGTVPGVILAVFDSRDAQERLDRGRHLD